MLRSIKETLANSSSLIYIKLLGRNYASCGGKSKISKENNFTLEERKNVIHNGHIQYITDFNIIYANPQEIHLYQIGTLYTDKTTKSYELSKKENYLGQKAKQNIEFFPKPIRIISNIHYIEQTKIYLNRSEIKRIIEETADYKQQFNLVIKELENKKIKYKIAGSIDEEKLTGLNILHEIEREKNERNHYGRPILHIINER